MRADVQQTDDALLQCTARSILQLQSMFHHSMYVYWSRRIAVRASQDIVQLQTLVLAIQNIQVKVGNSWAA